MILVFLLTLQRLSFKEGTQRPHVLVPLTFPSYVTTLQSLYVLDKLYYAPFPAHVLGLPSSEVLHMCAGLKSDPSIRTSLIASTSISTEPLGSLKGMSQDFPLYPSTLYTLLVITLPLGL